jgi:NAD+ synthase
MARLVGIPDEIVNQSPSAGFWRGQTDESELSITYKTADSILHLLIEKNSTPEEIESRGFQRMDIERVLSLVRRSRFKRHMPPIVPLKNQMRDELL